MTQQRDNNNDANESVKNSRGQNGFKTVVIILVICGVGGLIACGCLGVGIAFLLPAWQIASVAPKDSQSRNNLKQIALGVYNFDATYSHFPPRDPTQEMQPGEKPQSWLTEILPFVDQAQTYNLLNRQAAWNESSNFQAISVVVPAYLSPDIPTTKDLITGYGLAHYAGNEHVFGVKKPLTITDFTDGLSNTMMAGSVSNDLHPWGDPGNLRDPAAGIGPGVDQLSAMNPELMKSAAFALILMADGSVRIVNANAGPQVMQGLAKPSDGVLPGNF